MTLKVMMSAQIELLTFNQEVMGSIPIALTNKINRSCAFSDFKS